VTFRLVATIVTVISLVVGGLAIGWWLRDSTNQPVVAEREGSIAANSLKADIPAGTESSSPATDDRTQSAATTAQQQLDPQTSGLEQEQQSIDDEFEPSATPQAFRQQEADHSSSKSSPVSEYFRTAISQEPLPFTELCFRGFESAPPTKDELRHWFAPVPGQSGAMKEARTRGGQCVVLEGVHRLLAPWAEQQILRVSINPQQRWNLYLYHGADGISLQWDQRQGNLVAYVVSRHEDQVRPSQYRLAATDQGRTRRASPRQPVFLNFQYQDGELVVSCGDIALLRAPMSEIPRDVFWEGRGEVHGLAVESSFPSPDRADDKPAAVDILEPGSMNWTGELEDTVSWEQTMEGAVRLVSNDASQSAWIAAPLPRRGLQLVDVQLSNVSPGTGVFLFSDARPPGVAVRFVEDRRSQRTCATLSSNANETAKSWKAPSEALVPFVGESVWVRLACNAGVLRWWIGCDGRNWADSDILTTGMQDPVTHIGLQHAAGGRRSIQLDRIVVRPYTTFPSLVSPVLRDAAAMPPLKGKWEDWLEAVMSIKPTGVDAPAWQRAMAVKSLEHNCDARLGCALLSRLLDDPDVRRLPANERLRFVADAALIAGQPNLGSRMPTIWDRFFEVGVDAWWRHGDQPFSIIRQDVMNARLVRYHQPRWDFENAIRLELLFLLGELQWRKLRETIRMLDFHRLAENQPLLEWARRRVDEELGGDSDLASRNRRVFRWQPPYAEELSREAYNAVVELKTLLDSGSLAEAARSIGNARLDRISGVTPSLSDRQLRFAPRVAVQAMMEEFPELAQHLEQESGQLARLRVRQGIDSGDVSRVRQAVDQFLGTAAATDGQMWLGDLQLSRGHGAAAVGYYRAAMKYADDQLASQLQARTALAYALRGMRVPVDFRETLHVGEYSLSPEQFTDLVEDLLAAHAVAGQSRDAPALHDLSSRRIQERQFIAWRMGEKPEQPMLPGVDQLSLDVAGRQSCMVVHGDLLLLGNRFQLLALDANSLKTKWVSPSIAEKMLPGQDWGLIPMRPLVLGSVVICRQLVDPYPAMVCCHLESGELVWVHQDENRVFASDPFVMQDRLACFTITRRQQFESALQLVFLDKATGQVEDSSDVLRLRDSWWMRRCCEVTVGEQGLFVVLGGVTVAVDHEGRVIWIRESESLPIEADVYAVRQQYRSAVLADQRLLISQPGSLALECLDPDSGVLFWKRVLPDIEAILGVHQNSAIVRLRRHIASIDVRSGNLLWRRELEDQLLAAGYFGPDGLLVSRAVKPDTDRKELCPQLLLVDARNGEIRQQLTLESLLGPQPRLGPIVAAGNRLFALSGNGHRTPNRELILLAPP
jgi:hypothetical protein